MERILEFLHSCDGFFLATSDPEVPYLPHLRPFGVVTVIDGRLYLCSNNTKACFQQIIKNPWVELCALKGHNWLRLSGKLVCDQRPAVRAQFLKDCPLPYYTYDDGIFEVFYFSEMTARYYDDITLEETQTFPVQV